MCQSGYMGGDIINPKHNNLRLGNTNHIEVVEIYFDEEIITLDSLLEIFWSKF